MQTKTNYKKLAKLSIVTLTFTSTAWLCYQIRKSKDILIGALDTKILNVIETDLKKLRNDKNYFIENVVNEIGDMSPLHRIKDSIRLAFALKLVNLTRTENKLIRTQSVNRLSQISTLKNWQYHLLSNVIHAKTAVKLARNMNVDERFFTEPQSHYLTYTQNMLVEAIKELLIDLDKKSKHACMTYFISNAFPDIQEVGRLVEHDLSSVELRKYIQSHRDIIPMCLESLVHHTNFPNYARDLIEMNGLPLLMEIYNRFKNDKEVNVKLCRIISHISIHCDLLEDIYRTGWITVLHKWINDEDIRISLPAIKALANLDKDEDSVYSHRLYLIHPVMDNLEKLKADVVFVHGLLGGVFYTWRQSDARRNLPVSIKQPKNIDNLDSGRNAQLISNNPERIKTSDPNTTEYLEVYEEYQRLLSEDADYEIVMSDLPINGNSNASGPLTFTTDIHSTDSKRYTYCWPKDWLSQDCNRLRIIGVNYDTNISMWTSICPAEKARNTLEDRSDELIEHLVKAGLGSRPIVWVTHSMGGLIVKHLLAKAFESDRKELKNIPLNTKGIVFYSTPHIGSAVAKLNQASSFIFWPSVEVTELKENSPKLLDIHEKFLNIIEKVPIKIITFVETKSTVVSAMKLKFLLVAPYSGNPGVGEYFETPHDHLGICKPADRHSFLYQKVLELIKEVVSDSLI